MEQASLDQWQSESAKSLDLIAMDNLVKDYQAARKDYDDAKEIASEKYKLVDELEKQVVDTLKAANKKSYVVDGVGRATIKHKYVVTTPKTGETKWKVLDYIMDKYGVEVRDTYISVNHQAVNSFYNSEKEINILDPNFNIPGLELPTLQESLSFTKAK